MENHIRDLKKEKKLALSCGIVAFFISALWLIVGHNLFHQEALISPWQFLTFSLSWDMWMILLTLLIILHTQKQYTSISFDTMDGKNVPEMKIQKHLMRDVFMQVILSIPIHIAFSFYAPTPLLTLVPASVTLIGFGTLAYYIGYQLRPPLRIFGFTCMFIPNLALCLYVIYISFF